MRSDSTLCFALVTHTPTPLQNKFQIPKQMELRSDIMNPVGSFEFEMDKDARNAPYVFKHEELNKILTFVHTLCDGSGDDVLSFLKSTVCTPLGKAWPSPRPHRA